MPTTKLRLALAAALYLLAAPARAQAPTPPPNPPQGEALRVFFDCPSWVCDLDFLRTEITFVNYMRDRTDAQVFVLVTTMGTGGGGQEYTLTFIGQRDLQGRTDTLRYVSRQGDTPDEIRRGLSRVLRLGLVRYTAGTAIAEHLDVRYNPPAASGPTSPRERPDRWNRWVFRSSLSTYFSGEQSTAYNSYSGSFSANRVTEAWKLQFSLYGNQNRNRYEIPVYDSLGNVSGDTTYRTTRESWEASGLVVRGLGAHWSAGLRTEISGSTSRNTHSRLMAAPAIEWDLFPYAQATRRQLRMEYSIGVETANYRDTTLYGRVSETFGRHSLGVSLSLRQPWGNASMSASGTQYWNDARNPNLDLYASVEVRIVRGLSASFWGSYSFVRSQRYLPAMAATPEDVLLQLRQLRTAYYLYGNIGLSYTFGSVYNNVVNPRFGGSSM